MKKRQNRRLFTVFTLIVTIFSVLTINVFIVAIGGYHINSNTHFGSYVDDIYTRYEPVIAKRGAIIDVNGNVLAQDNVAFTLYAYIAEDRYDSQQKPAFVDNKEDAAKKISKIIGMPEKEVFAILTRENAKQVEFGTKGKYLTSAQKKELEATEIPGLGFTRVTSREYYSKNFASSLIGVTTFNETDKTQTGIMGIEKYYQDVLNGENGLEVYRQDRDAYRFDTIESLSKTSVEGKDIQLTIDRIIQESLDTTLKNLMTDPKVMATEAWGAVVEVKTGKILAISDAPSFDLSDPNTSYINRATQYQYEPGSTMKTITFASALDAGAIDPDKTFDANRFYLYTDPKTGKASRVYKPGPNTAIINNPGQGEYGQVKYSLGYQRSMNTMIADVLVNSLDPEVLRQDFKDLGFFTPVDLGSVPTASGKELWNYYHEKVTNGFGQGSTVTMLQIMQAHSALFGDGTVIKPYLIESITNPNTKEVEFKAEVSRGNKVYKEDTVDKIRYYMYENVNELPFSNSRFKMDEVNIMAKTGTAQIVLDKGYSKDTYIYSVMQGFPYEDPQYMYYVAYQGKEGHSTRASANLMKNVISTIISAYPLETNDTDDVDKPVESLTLKNYINLEVKDVRESLKKQGFDPIVFGDGSTIINQYPKQGVKLLSNEKLMFLTSTENLKVPDMTGWSAKEVNAFSQFARIEINIKGNGFVKEQSLAEGEIIKKDTKIEVILK